MCGEMSFIVIEREAVQAFSSAHLVSKLSPPCLACKLRVHPTLNLSAWCPELPLLSNTITATAKLLIHCKYVKLNDLEHFYKYLINSNASANN
jgi:hypothetical protein